METLFLVLVVAGLVAGVAFMTRKSKTTGNSTSSGGAWTGGGNTPDRGDGSVTPPSSGTNAV
jgi:hypothetical protein